MHAHRVISVLVLSCTMDKEVILKLDREVWKQISVDERWKLLSL